MHSAVPAPLGRRVAAYILDSVLLNIVFEITMRILFGGKFHEWLQAVMQSLVQNTQPPEPDARFVFWALAVPFLYSTIFWSALGALPAQFLLKMKVVQHETLRLLNPLQAAVRYLCLTFILVIMMIIPIIAPVVIFFVLHFAAKDSKKRALHDHLAKSIVIDVSPSAQHTENNHDDDGTTGRAF